MASWKGNWKKLIFFTIKSLCSLVLGWMDVTAKLNSILQWCEQVYFEPIRTNLNHYIETNLEIMHRIVLGKKMIKSIWCIWDAQPFSTNLKATRQNIFNYGHSLHLWVSNVTGSFPVLINPLKYLKVGLSAEKNLPDPSIVIGYQCSI